MSLLLSNDDGVHAPGLRMLAETLSNAGHELYVVAPDRDRSGASNSLTLDRPLHPVTLDNGYIGLNGTPTDCVHLGTAREYTQSTVRPRHSRHDAPRGRGCTSSVQRR